MKGAALLLCLLAAGCSTTEMDGTKRYVVIGFGVVSVIGSTNQAAQITKVKALGVYGGAGFNLGYINQTRVTVETNANVLLELK